MERVFDIMFSLCALLILLPIFFLIYIMLSLTGEGKVIFKQNRVGKDGLIIQIFKFVTMLENSPNLGTGTLTIKNDPRILPYGKFLRNTKINELPQLFNILMGDLSLVGPRPLTEKNYKMYDKVIQKDLNKVKPGLSGIGSIIFRNEEEILSKDQNPINFYKNVITPYKGALERWFIKNKCIKNYFLIIILTIIIIFTPKTNIIWKTFKTIPTPPKTLEDMLNYHKS